MPKINGIEMIKKIREENFNQEILITTAFFETHYLLKAIELDVGGYLIKPIKFDKINTTLHKVVDRINMQKENKIYKTQLEELVKEKTTKNLILQHQQIDNYEKTLISLVELVEKRDTYTGGHSKRVAKYSKMIARHMGFSKKDCELVYKAGILHDIGKIETPDAVLLNPGKLSDFQYSIIKEHVSTGANMLKKIPMYAELSKIIAQHHERHDGKGYPAKLKGSDILPLARIMIVSDAFDAMTTNRIYKPRMSKEKALQELSTFSNKQFDPIVAKHAIEVFKDMNLEVDIFQLPSTEMEEKKFAFFFEDQLTGAYNETYLELSLVQNINTNTAKYLSIILLHNFHTYNKKYGWSKGNLLLKNIADILQKTYGESCVFRLQGDEFIVFMKNYIKIKTSTLDTLIAKSGGIVTIELKELNMQKQHIKTISDLRKFL
jgi:putative nucleotidyltransferase with HDIG domain/diguanylate cyclase (GGDEF)-like protein